MDKMKKRPTGAGARKRELPERKRQEIQEAFTLFDNDKDGEIDYHELKVALRALGFEMKKADVVRLMREYDVEGRGKVTLDQFSDMVTELVLARDPLEEWRQAFTLFDEDSSGRISLKNLRRVARELGETLQDDELRAMIDEFDRDGDGEINFDEFVALMSGEDVTPTSASIST
jgi:centrin-3